MHEDHKRETFELAWAQVGDDEAGLLLIVSVDLGAEMPEGFAGVQRLRVGRGLPVEISLSPEGLSGSFGIGFPAAVPWRALLGLIAPDWSISWKAVDPPPSFEAPRLRVVK